MTESASAGRSAFCVGLAIVGAVALLACAPNGRHQAPDGGSAGGYAGTSGGSGGVNDGSGGASDGNADSGVPSGRHPLAISAQEAVTRVANVLWKGTPDADLTKRADTGAINTREDVNQLALEMLKDPRARAGVGAFYRWWLWLDAVAAQSTSAGIMGDVRPDPTRFPEWTPAISQNAANETETFAVGATLDMDGGFRTLMTAPFSYLNQRLATLYGITGIIGDELRKIALDPAQRGGLLTQPSLLSMDNVLSTTDPPRRGRLIQDRFFCQPVPPITPAPPLPLVAPNSSGRQRFEMATAGNPCHFCHYEHQLNPLGIPFEGFDQIGRQRTVDDTGHLVDVRGLKLRDASGTDVSFDGPAQLATLLTNHPDVQRCMGKQWLTFALGRALTTDEASALDDIHAAFKASGLDLRVLIAAVVSSELFLLPPGAHLDAGVSDGAGGKDAGSGGSCASTGGTGGGGGTTTGPLPEGCVQANSIFSNIRTGCQLCHRPGIPGNSTGGFDMVTPGWERRLVGAGPPDCAPYSNLCKGQGRVYLNKTQPATGLFLDKLKANPTCGDQMPRQLPPLTDSDLACIQKWANNVVAGGPGH
ncbi:MAG: hypothetical protein QOI66_1814 [Myxococcales bacterium]|nr:hypothetical protein [Myxococcales bacterium]